MDHTYVCICVYLRVCIMDDKVCVWMCVCTCMCVYMIDGYYVCVCVCVCMCVCHTPKLWKKTNSQPHPWRPVPSLRTCIFLYFFLYSFIYVIYFFISLLISLFMLFIYLFIRVIHFHFPCGPKPAWMHICLFVYSFLYSR